MDDAQRLAYEERRKDERRQEREREDAYREELEAEDARRLSRYDEAIRLLRLAKFDEEHWREADAFLAAEPEETKRMVFEEITPAEANRRYRAYMKAKS